MTSWRHLASYGLIAGAALALVGFRCPGPDPQGGQPPEQPQGAGPGSGGSGGDGGAGSAVQNGVTTTNGVGGTGGDATGCEEGKVDCDGDGTCELTLLGDGHGCPAELHAYGDPIRAFGVSYSPADFEKIAVSVGNSVHVYDGGSPMQYSDVSADVLVVTQTQVYFATNGAGYVYLFAIDLDQGTVDEIASVSGNATALAASPTGEALVMATETTVYRLQNGMLNIIAAEQEPIVALAAISNEKVYYIVEGAIKSVTGENQPVDVQLLVGELSGVGHFDKLLGFGLAGMPHTLDTSNNSLPPQEWPPVGDGMAHLLPLPQQIYLSTPGELKRVTQNWGVETWAHVPGQMVGIGVLPFPVDEVVYAYNDDVGGVLMKTALGTYFD